MKGWEKQAEWHGNPAIGFESYVKKFPTPTGRKVPVYVYGCRTEIQHEGCTYLGFQYVVSAGADSDFSHGGSFHPLTVLDPEQAMLLVEALANTPHRGRSHLGSQLIH